MKNKTTLVKNNFIAEQHYCRTSLFKSNIIVEQSCVKKNNMFNFIAGSLICFLVLSCFVKADIMEECSGVADQNYITSEKGCSWYIYCHGDESFEDQCPPDAPFFSMGECGEDESVCERTDDDTVATSVSTTIIAHTISQSTVSATPIMPSTLSTTISASTTAAVLTSNSAAVALTTIAATATSITSAPTNQPTLVASTIFTAATSSPEIIPPNTIISSQCPKIDQENNIVFLPSNTSCSQYYLCYNGEAKQMFCSSSFHFDLRQKKCDFPEKVQCQLENVALREQCLPQVYDLFPHPVNCNYYYICNHGFLMVMQCPPNLHWDYQSRACVLQGRARCYSSRRRSLQLKQTL